MPPRVAVVFGTYNRFAFLRRAVESVRSAASTYPATIVVVDGGSTDGSRAWLAEQPDVVLLGQRGELTGAVRAFNAGFGYAVEEGFDFIGHLNDDAELLGAGALDRAAEILASDPKVGEVAFEFDLRGRWMFEVIYDLPYGNFGLVRREAGMVVARAQGDPTGRAWWNPIYHTYAADCEFACWLYKLGYSVHKGEGLRVHDLNAKDELRAGNERTNKERRDSERFWQRWPREALKTAAPLTWKPGTKLHLGCGDKHLPGWMNVDGRQSPAADYVEDFSSLLRRLPPGVLSHVYWSHGPEHVPPDLLPGMLAGLRRAIAPGGKLTVATIDLMGIVDNRYKSQKNGPQWNLALFGQTSSADPLYFFHRQCFDEAMLGKLLRDAGFSTVRKWTPEEYPDILRLQDYATTCRLVSLHMEACA